MTQMKISDVKTLGDVAKFRIDVLQSMKPSEEKRALRKKLQDKRAELAKEEQKKVSKK